MSEPRDYTVNYYINAVNRCPLTMSLTLSQAEEVLARAEIIFKKKRYVKSRFIKSIGIECDEFFNNHTPRNYQVSDEDIENWGKKIEKYLKHN